MTMSCFEKSILQVAAKSDDQMVADVATLALEYIERLERALERREHAEPIKVMRIYGDPSNE